MAEPDNLVKPETEAILDKLINITRVAQFEQLNLSDEDCDKLIQEIDAIESRVNENEDHIEKVRTARAEFVPIMLSDEDYI